MEAYFGELTPGRAEELRARRAIIVYEGAGMAYASVHPVTAPTSGKPRLGPGAPVTDAFTRAFLASIGEEVAPEYLPPEVLYRAHDLLVWWTPGRSEEMRFCEGSELRTVSGSRFPLPPLVWRLSAAHLAVRAISESTRPDPNTAVFVAPFWNTAPSDGVVCEGSMLRPKTRTPASIGAWDDAFFGSEFTHQAGGGSLSHTAYAKLTASLAGRDGPYPADELVNAQERTLSSFALANRAHGGGPW